MNIGLDGLGLGPLSLSWQSLTLALGLLSWFALARHPHAEKAALVTLVVARVWAAAPGLDTARPLLQNVLDVVDLRRGAWAWGPGLVAGVLALLWFHRPRPLREFPPGLVRALAVSVVVAALPGLLRPAPQGAQVRLPDTPLPALVRASAPDVQGVQSVQDVQEPSPLKRGSVVNFWATWCGPCRAELPLLESAVRDGAAIELVNVGESADQVRTFLNAQNLTLTTRLGGEAIGGPLGISAFPTTLAVNAAGEVVARHLGPLSGAQLQHLLEAALAPPARD